MEITWKEDGIHQCRDLYFQDLEVGDTFKIIGSQAVYVKIQDKTNRNTIRNGVCAREYMCELATSKFFLPTGSPVEKVQVVMNIDVRKPNLYN